MHIIANSVGIIYLLVFIISIVAPVNSQTPPVNPSTLTCPCIGSIQSGCLQYDPRFQATSLEEAIVAFPDLTQDQDALQPNTIEEQATCATQECVDCHNDLRMKLQEVGLMPAAIDQAITAQGNYTNCTRYSFTKNKEEDEDDSDESSEHEREGRDKHNDDKDKHKDKRHRRQLPFPTVSPNAVTDPNTLGTSYTLSCTKKGIVTDSKDLVSLCSSCWVWRKLPDNYSPQYINELVCDSSDNSCLSGYATCNVGMRTLEVSRNDNGVLTKLALTAGTYCECKTTAGSAIDSLVLGKGLTEVIPPMTSAAP